MPFNNSFFGFLTKAFRKSLFVETTEGNSSPPPPPGDCFLGIQVTSGILAIQVTEGDLSVHCITSIYDLVNYQGNQYVNYLGEQYIEIQT